MVEASIFEQTVAKVKKGRWHFQFKTFETK